MKKSAMEAKTVAEIRRLLLRWFDEKKRDLPWRGTHDPYAIWVSEIMLQQTRVAAVIEKYNMFMTRFSTVQVLAAASEADVLALWSGLGYYRRARMLHRAARVVVDEYCGVMPVTAQGLRELPGIGAYTSAAIASIAHGERVAVVDGNVERVVQRLAGWGSTDPTHQGQLRKRIDAAATELLAPDRPGDFNQSMMELGAVVCVPRGPQCLICPVRVYCRTQGEHLLPERAKMRSQLADYALVMRAGKVLLRQRPASETVMTGMWELLPLLEAAADDAEPLVRVKHAIMQVNYDVRVWELNEKDARRLAVGGGEWVAVSRLEELPLTGLARKVLTKRKVLKKAQ